jgi:hypothetical protein
MPGFIAFLIHLIDFNFTSLSLAPYCPATLSPGQMRAGGLASGLPPSPSRHALNRSTMSSHAIARQRKMCLHCSDNLHALRQAGAGAGGGRGDHGGESWGTPSPPTP